MTFLSSAWLGCALAVTGCTGTVGGGRDHTNGGSSTDDPSNPGGSDTKDGTKDGKTGGGSGSSPGVTDPAPGSAMGQMRLLRLTRDQYSNTMRDLLGNDEDLGRDLPYDLAGDSGFFEPGSVGVLEVRRFMELADRAASAAVKNLPGLLGCDPAKDETGCVNGFLDRFAKRAYRRPLLPDEQTALRTYYTTTRMRPGTALDEAVAAVLSTMLQSPNFLYHWELGPRKATAKNGQISLTSYELASRLSYFLWNSMPDDALFAAAEAGTLSNADELAKQARRMLASDKTKATIQSFHNQWLDLDRILTTEKDPTAYKDFNDALRTAMADETKTFLNNVFFEGDGKLDTLLGASYSFVNDKLAKLYGMTGVTGSQMLKKDLDATQRFGLLTQGSFLAGHAYPYESAPVKRGVVVREQLLCQSVPPPPANLNVMPPQPDPKKSVREQFVQHSQDPSCKGCHSQFDPLGFAFENYDGIGKYRTTSGGKPVDASGMLSGIGSGEKSFSNARDLVGILRDAPEVQRCVASLWLRYAIGRRDGAEDAGSLDQAYAAFQKSGRDVRELLVALTQTPSFRFRTPSAGEVIQ